MNHGHTTDQNRRTRTQAQTKTLKNAPDRVVCLALLLTCSRQIFGATSQPNAHLMPQSFRDVLLQPDQIDSTLWVVESLP